MGDFFNYRRATISGLAISRLAIFGLALAVLVPSLRAAVVLAAGPDISKALRDGGPEDVMMQRKNSWTVTIAAGAVGDTSMRFADELGRALDDGNDLRVLPISSRGPAGNLEDLLRLPDVDLAVTQSDILEYFRTERKAPIPGDKLRYVARLPAAELHVTARADIHTMEELRGRKVVFGPPGSAAAVTGPLVFRRLGIAVKPVFMNLPEGTKAFADLYVEGRFTSADYPNLLSPGERIDTIAVPSVLAVQNVPKSDDRFRRVLRFVQYLTARWDRLDEPPFHPGWRAVSLAATVPGWTRFSASEVFRQFILWRDQQHKP